MKEKDCVFMLNYFSQSKRIKYLIHISEELDLNNKI